MTWYLIGWLALAQCVDGVGRVERLGAFHRPLPGHPSYPVYQLIAGISFLLIVVFFIWGFFLDPWWAPFAALGRAAGAAAIPRAGPARAQPAGPWPAAQGRPGGPASAPDADRLAAGPHARRAGRAQRAGRIAFHDRSPPAGDAA